jgi:hypothetical protein
MRREVRVHRRRVVIVVIRVHVRVQERRAHGATLNGQRQTECQDAANHTDIVDQNRVTFIGVAWQSMRTHVLWRPRR